MYGNYNNIMGEVGRIPPDFYKITLAAMIAPLMYLIVFGMGIQTTSHGHHT